MTCKFGKLDSHNYLHFFRDAERRAKEKLIEYISTSMMNSTNMSNMTNNTTFTNANNFENGYHSSTIEISSNHSEMPDSPPRLIDASSNHYTFITAEADLSQLSLEIEKEKTEYQEKSRHLQEQLDAFRHEIDELKVDENVTTMDRIHRQQQDQGNTKYSTIQKIKRGTTHSRVEIFEELWTMFVLAFISFVILLFPPLDFGHQVLNFHACLLYYSSI